MAKLARKTCPFCSRIMSKLLWQHIRNVHPEHNDLDDYQIVCLVRNLKEIPMCANPNCNNRAAISYGSFKFKDYCSVSCANSVRSKNNWKDPKYAKMMSEMKAYHWTLPWYREMMTPINSRNMTELNKKLWSNPEFVERKRQEFPKRLEDPEYRKMMYGIHSRTLSKLWENPEFRNKMSIVTSQRNIENWKNPEYRNYMESVVSEIYGAFRVTRRSRVEIEFYEKS